MITKNIRVFKTQFCYVCMFVIPNLFLKKALTMPTHIKCYRRVEVEVPTFQKQSSETKKGLRFVFSP